MTVAHRLVSPEEYLAQERALLEGRNEYVNGQVHAMTGASLAHSTITGNVGAALRAAGRGRGCRAFVNDMRVHVPATRMYTYPDVVALCGTPQLMDDRQDTLLNPSVIVEVLSPSTEAYDRGDKFAHYQRIASLQEYVLVAQDRVAVSHFRRHDLGWLLTTLDDPAAVLELPSYGARLSLAEIYDAVELPPIGTTRAPATP